MRRLMAAAEIMTMAVPALAGPAPAAQIGQSAADARFEAIYTGEWQWRQTQMAPDEDSPEGQPTALPEIGPAAQQAKLNRWTKVENGLAAIDRAALSPENRINYAVYKGQIDALLAAQRYRDYEMPLTSDTSFWGDVAALARGSFRTEQDYRNYIAMMRDVPRYYHEQIANMRAGLKRGFTLPRVTLDGRDKGVAKIVAAGATEEAAPAPVVIEPAKTSCCASGAC